jgi:hypothetical protein
MTHHPPLASRASSDLPTVSSTRIAVEPAPAEERSSDGRGETRPRGWRPARADVLGLLASCALVLIAFFPVVFGGRMLSTAGKGAAGVNGTSPFVGQPRADYSADFRADQGASTWQAEPWAEVNHRALSQGELPFWNPYQAAGSPQMANQISEPFDPLLFLVNLHPSERVWDFSIIGAYVLGAAAMFIFARVLGLEALPSVVASAAFSLSGYFFLYSNNSFSRAYIYLPVLFLLVELILRSRRLLPVFGFGVAVAGCVLVGMPEATFFIFAGTGIYAVVRIVQTRRSVRPLTSLARFVGGAALGVALAAPVLLPFQQYEALSFNTHKASSAQAAAGDPTYGVLNWIVPFFHGIRAPFNAPGVRDWVGIAVMVAVVAGLSGRRETRRLHAWVFASIAALVVLKMYNAPIIKLVAKLPIVEQTNILAYSAPIAGFALAVLAGIGIQVILKRDLRVRRFLLLLGAVVSVFVIIAVTGDRWQLASTPPNSYLREVWLRALLLGGVVFAAALLARRFDSRWVAGIAAAAIIVELFTLVPFSIYETRADPFARPKWMNLVEQSMGKNLDRRVFALDARLFPNTASAFGLQDIRVIDALYVERYWRYIKTFVQPTVTDRFNGGPYASGETTIAQYQGNPMFDALGVRVFLSQTPLTGPGLGGPAVSGGDTRGVDLRFLGNDLDTQVYENVNAYPRAWIVHDIHTVDGEDAAFRYLQARGTPNATGAVIVDRFDPRSEAVIERQDGTENDLAPVRAGAASCDPASDRVTVADYSVDKVKLDVNAACAGLVVLPDTYFPGWRATVNGQDKTVYPTDGAFRGVVVPQGRSTIELTYRPTRFNLGLVLAVLGLAVFAAIALVQRRGRVVREQRARRRAAVTRSDAPSRA